ncbi:TetR family transcriptional regulator [Streptomyces broussonetiae]|uniref:TetR family transcriptional regulator n=1 Tax=Streptomyces broussonetiae TaxID=2686304 RepID=UPI0035E072BE
MSEQVTRETEPGRRDRKKAATRRTLLQTATRMFAERGYQETTVKDIAAAAGVTERTFFRYFPSKEDLVFAEILDFVPLVRQEIPRRPPGEPPLTAVLNSLLAAAAGIDGGLAILFVGAPPRALTGQTRRTHVLTDFEDGIAAALTERLAAFAPQEPPRRRDLRASVLARASVAAVRSALLIHTRDHARGDGEAGSPALEDFRTLLEEAFAVLRAQDGEA